MDINLKDGDAATPLHFAASRGHADCVSYLSYQKSYPFLSLATPFHGFG